MCLVVPLPLSQEFFFSSINTREQDKERLKSAKCATLTVYIVRHVCTNPDMHVAGASEVHLLEVSGRVIAVLYTLPRYPGRYIAPPP